MKTLALLAGLTVVTILTGTVIADRTASETSIVLPDQDGSCAECVIPHPTQASSIPQESRDGTCVGCASQQSNESTSIPETTAGIPAPSTEKPADGSGNCTDCTAEQLDGPRIPITSAPPPVKLSEHAAGCADCAVEESRRQALSRQSGGLKQRPTRQAHSSAPTRNRHAAHRGQRQQSLSGGDCPFSAEIKRVFSLM
jgi:hypothetical protein